eukprot:Pompholyxophrys_sp_v1_NODE_13_length_4899_cov_11.419162.p2 type:complete len:128 gc:universal NODE_13_length_4899_cov_11.419162:2520-2903(+)
MNATYESPVPERDEGCENIPDISEVEMLVMTYAIRHKLTVTAMDDMFRLLRTLHPDIYAEKSSNGCQLLERIIGCEAYCIKYLCKDCGQVKEEFLPCAFCGNMQPVDQDTNFFASFDLEKFLQDRYK